MTEQTRRGPAHPTTDELADWHAGVLDDPAAVTDITAHVAACPDCAAEVAALDAVAALLAEAGAESVEMPDDVAAAIDAAVARVSLERAYDVASLDERRATAAGSGAVAPDRRRRLSPAIGWMAGAAAVVVIAGLGYQALNPGPTEVSGSSSTAGSGADPEADGQSAATTAPGRVPGALGGAAGSSGGRPGKQSSTFGYALLPPEPVTKADVAAYARRLAAANSGVRLRPDATARYSQGCAVPKPTKGHVVARVRWDRARAYLDVNRETHVVTVYNCGSPPVELFSTSY